MDFDYWMNLYRKNPLLFEQKRREMNEQELERISEPYGSSVAEYVEKKLESMRNPDSSDGFYRSRIDNWIDLAANDPVLFMRFRSRCLRHAIRRSDKGLRLALLKTQWCFEDRVKQLLAVYFYEAWSALHRTDSGLFECRMREEIGILIRSSPERIRPFMERLQWRIDRERARCRTPLQTAVKLSDMMWEFFYKPGGFHDTLTWWSEGASESHEPTEVARRSFQREADVLEFKPKRTD